MFRNDIAINEAYRYGKSRVGCLVCPFSTSWDDMIVNKRYSESAAPFLSKISEWAKYSGILDIKPYIQDRKWKIKAIGGDGISKARIVFEPHSTDFVAKVKNGENSILAWLPALGQYTMDETEKGVSGTVKIKDRIYNYEVSSKEDETTLRVYGISNNPQLTYLLKRLVYKGCYCVHCEVCEVDCPTGALHVFPEINIDSRKCIHCHRCFDTHDKGCIAADSIRMIKDMDKKANAKIKGYKTFGLRDEWLSEYFPLADDFWGDNSLGTAQEEGFKAWLKDAEIIDAKNRPTKFGQLVADNYVDDPTCVWELLSTNLSYNSFVVNWFADNIGIGKLFDSKSLEMGIMEQYPDASSKTVANAVRALMQTINMSPLGEELKWGNEADGKYLKREAYTGITPIGMAYALYKYAEQREVRTLRVSDFYSEDCHIGPAKTFGLTQADFIRVLKELNSQENRVLVAELNMGLDSITLRDDMGALTVLEQLLR